MNNAQGPKEGQSPDQPTNNPNKVINSPEEVQESNDEKIDQDFPGYPHYPAKDDILNPANGTERVDLEVEDLSRTNTITANELRGVRKASGPEPAMGEEVTEELVTSRKVESVSADLTPEDMAALGPVDGDMDMGEDEELRRKGYEPQAGGDLDMPTEVAEDDLAGQDEENDYYSLGGDEKVNLEENDDKRSY